MDTFIKIFYESGTGGEQRLEDAINEFIAEQDVDIVDVKVIFRKGAFEDTMFIVVTFKKKEKSNYHNEIEEIKLVAMENVPREMQIGNSDDIVSTVGVKILRNGECYGDYTVLNKATLEVSDVVDTANELFCALLTNTGLDDGKDGKD